MSARGIGFGAMSRAFLDHLAERNYSPRTIRGHRGNLRGFLAHLTELGIADLRGVTRETAWAYARMLLDRPLASHTKILKLATLRLFFRYLTRARLVLVDPTAALPRLKEAERLPRTVMTRDEANLLLAQPDLDTFRGLRDRTMMEVLYSTGMRAAELLALAVADIDLADGLVRINRGKGRRDRIVPLGKVAQRFVREYLRKARPRFAGGNPEGPLFLASPGRALGYNTLAGRVRAYVGRAELAKRITCHTFRHTCATEMLRGGSSIRHVQEMLGHADITTTQVYTRVLPLDLLAAHGRCHPLERRRQAVPDAPAGGAPMNLRRVSRRVPAAPPAAAKLHRRACRTRARHGYERGGGC